MNDKQIMIALVFLVKKQCDVIFYETKCQGCPMCDGDMCKIKIMNWDWEKLKEKNNVNN